MGGRALWVVACVVPFVALLLIPPRARADEPLPSASASAVPCTNVAPPSTETPEGLASKRRLRDDDYAKKVEGGYVTGIPLANYDPSTLVGFGARGYYYYDGYRSNPLFAYTPYLHRVIVQAFATTAGAQDHMIDYDAPNFMGTLFRLRATLEYQAANAWPYYGVGTRSLNGLSFPGAPGKTFPNAGDYDKATSAVQPDGTTYANYNLLGVQKPTLQLGVERLFFGGILRPFVGIGLSYIRLTDFTGQLVGATDAGGNSVKAPEATTLLASDCASGRIVGCGGGFDNVLRLAVSLDTRDFEPDPNSGIYAELSTEIGTKLLGGQYDYLRMMLSVRAFYSPIPKIADLVVAVRGLYEGQTSGTPFSSLSLLPFIDDNHEGLGGLRSLRGFRQNRFVGPIMALTNYELRWTFYHFRFLKQGFGLGVVPFLDIGRVFDRVDQTTLAGWKRTQGLGFRISWNEATIILVDYGVSEEDSGLYINFNHMF